VVREGTGTVSSEFPLAMRRLIEAAAFGYAVLTFAALVIPPGSSLASFTGQPVISTLLGPSAVMFSSSSWSSFGLASAVVAVTAGIAWAIWRYDPAVGVGLFWTTVAVLAWLACGWLAWAVHAF
jgi:hypothetical protein